MLNVLVCTRFNLICNQLCPCGNLRIIIECYGNLVGPTIGRKYIRRDLGIRHLDSEHFPILHSHSQFLFTRKRLHADQSPVPAHHGLRVDFCNLFFCQFRAILALQAIGLLQAANCAGLIYLPDPGQIRIGEF